MNNVYLLIGGNMGDRSAMLELAIQNIEAGCGKIIQTSSVYRTSAWGNTEQPDFYNQCLQLETELEADTLMNTLLSIESEMGRVRNEKMGPRYIDIDILLFNNAIIETKDLQIPHPRLHLRRFALIPLSEIAADEMHPVLNKTIKELANDCTDELDVHKI